MDGLAPAPAPDDGAAQLALAVAGVAMVPGAWPELWHRAVGEGFASGRTVRGSLQSVDSGAGLRFVLPAGADIAFVRLRLPALAGCYRIESVVVAGVAVEALAHRVMQVRDRLLPSFDTAAVRIAASEHPPTLELDIRGLPRAVAGQGTHLDVRIVREDAAVSGAGQVADAVEALSADAMALLRAQGDAAFSAARGQRESDQALRERMDAHAASVAAEVAAVEARLTAAISIRADRHAGALAAIDEGLASRFAGIAPGFDVLHAGQQVQASATATLMAETQALRTEIAALRNSVDNVFWRRWLRRLRGTRQ